MEIIKFKKVSNNKYKIYFADGSEVLLFEDVIIKNNLLYKKNLDNKEVEKLINQNNEFEAYYSAIKYINIRMRSKMELKNYLIKKKVPEKLACKIIDKLSKEGYLNDLLFTKAFISDQMNLSPNGPLRIKKELLTRGIEEGLSSSEISKIDDDVIREKLSKLLKKQLRIKTGASNLIKLKLLNYFVNLGYEKDMVLDGLSKACIKTDDKKLKKDYDKLYNKYKNKYDKNKLNYVLSNKLYLKGYTKEEVKQIINK